MKVSETLPAHYYRMVAVRLDRRWRAYDLLALNTAAIKLGHIDSDGGGNGLSMEDDLETGLDRCFDAVARPETWPSAMAALASALGASGVCFNPNDPQADRLVLPASARYRDMLTEFVADGWASQDLRAGRGVALTRQGQRIVCEDDMTTPEERARTPIYIDLFARHQLEMFAGISLPMAGQMWTFNMVRSVTDGPFAGQELERMLRARPSLRRLLLFAKEMSRSTARSAVTALEQVAIAAMILDQRGQVLQLNAPAEALLGQGLDLRLGRLTAPDQASNAALETLVAGADGIHEPVCIRRPDRDPLMIEAVALKSDRTDIFGISGVLLLITDTSTRPVPALKLLRQAFGLTEREGAVAQGLASGENADAIAERLGLRQTSVRQIVKSVLGKTDTPRQGALVAKLARLPKARPS